MRSATRIALDAAAAALAFCRMHPADSRAAADAERRLAGLVRQARHLTDQVRLSRAELLSATAERDRIALALRVRVEALRRLSATVQQEQGIIGLHFRIALRVTAPNELRRTAHRVLTAAAAHRHLLLHYGMPATMFDDIEADLSRLDAAMARRHTVSAVASAAAADLTAVASQARRVVRHLDALHRIRLAADPAALAHGAEGSPPERPTEAPAVTPAA